MSDNNGSREVVVSTAWVAGRFGAPVVRLVEVDEDTGAYARGHIPGAVALHWKHELQDRVRRNFVDQETFEALLGRRGITEHDTVVLYGGGKNRGAAPAHPELQGSRARGVCPMHSGRKKRRTGGRRRPPDLPLWR